MYLAEKERYCGHRDKKTEENTGKMLFLERDNLWSRKMNDEKRGKEKKIRN